MATTGLDVFNAAMGLIDELVNGLSQNSGTVEYQNRTLPILNILLNRVYPYSDSKTVTAGLRSVCPRITSLSENLGIDDGLARSVLPYGLASHLLVEDNPAAASFYQQMFEENLKEFRNVPRVSEDIENAYGGLEYGYFGSW